ncbi:MAG TPA: ATP-binding cassette domain-containing protein [Thermoanaerobaculia bacterium]
MPPRSRRSPLRSRLPAAPARRSGREARLTIRARMRAVPIVNQSREVLRLDHVTAQTGKSACRDISFSVPSGSIHSVLGEEGSGKTAIISCVLGKSRPSSGRVWITGQDAWSDRRLFSDYVEGLTPELRIRRSVTVQQLSKHCAKRHERWDDQGLNQRLFRLGVPSDRAWKELAPAQQTAALLALALAGSPHLLVLHAADVHSPGAHADTWIQEVRKAASDGITVLIATDRPEHVENLTDGVSILREGTLLVTSSSDALKSRFRKIQYRNEITPERKDYGNELDEFDAARVRVRGWGVEAIVSNFSDVLYDRFRGIPGIVDAEALPMSLAEIFETVARPRRINRSLS